MKRYISAVLTATAIAGLTACGGAETPTSSTATPTARSVPDVAGATYLDARKTLHSQGFSVVLTGKDGKKWTNIVPNETVTVDSMDPVAGTTTSSSAITLTVNVSQDEFLAAGKVAAEAANVATRYDFQCYNVDQTQATFKSYKDVWASPSYAGGGTCQVTVAGKVPGSTGKHPLIPSEQALVDLVESKGGDVSAPITTVEKVMGLCAKLDPDYAYQEVANANYPKANAAGALSVCPDAPHAALLEAELTAIKVSDGNKVVGKTMEPGTYKTKPGVRDCYWSRNTAAGDIIDNDFVGFAPDGVTVTVHAGEGFESDRCAPWNKIG